jgi:hypothetical protein
MFCREDPNPFLPEAAVELCMVGDDEHDPTQKIIDGVFVDAVTGDHQIGNAGNFRDLGWDGKAGIVEPLPRAENFVDPPGLTVEIAMQIS